MRKSSAHSTKHAARHKVPWLDFYIVRGAEFRELDAELRKRDNKIIILEGAFIELYSSNEVKGKQILKLVANNSGIINQALEKVNVKLNKENRMLRDRLLSQSKNG